MAARLSTGLTTALMTGSGFRSVFTAGFIDIYSGAQPLSADSAPTGTKLVTLYSDGVSVGLTFAATAVAGVLSKGTAPWSGTALANGTAGWFRLREAADTGGASTTFKRFDGSIASSGGQMSMLTTTLVAGAPVIANTASFTLPTA